MNRTLLAACLALALTGTLAIAQEPAEAPAPPPQARQHAHNPHHEARKLSRQLGLTPDQTAKIEPILADRDQKMDALKADTSISPMIFNQQRKAIHQQTEQQLSTILTPDQLQQMKTLHHHNNSAPPAQAPPPPAGI